MEEIPLEVEFGQINSVQTINIKETILIQQLQNVLCWGAIGYTDLLHLDLSVLKAKKCEDGLQASLTACTYSCSKDCKCMQPSLSV